MTLAWTREHLASRDDRATQTRVLDETQTTPALPDLHIWDLWPVCTVDGAVAEFGGIEYWMALSALRSLPPHERHDVARLRMLSMSPTEGWRDCGPVFGEGVTPGSREWAGDAVHEPVPGRLSVRFTAAGHKGRPTTFVQRIFEATITFDPSVHPPLPAECELVEMIRQPVPHYRSTLDQDVGEAGFIKAFRDPAVFRDPLDGREHLLFTASLAGSTSDYDGAIGAAVRNRPEDPWTIREPLAHADGVNNEMERPHVVHRDGWYYTFFSTQARTFHPSVEGPTGLYGFGAESMEGPWSPLNGSGLVLRNPAQEPFQCYSWLVLDDLRVVSFVDMHSLAGRTPDAVEAAGLAAAHFGGTPGPVDQLALDGVTSRLLTADTDSP